MNTSAQPEAALGLTTRAATVHLELNRRLSWAAEHCGVPFVREVTVTNTGPEPLSDLTLFLQLEPNLGEAFQLVIPPLVPGESWSMSRLEFRSPAGHLRQVVEFDHLDLHWTLTSGSDLIAQGREGLDVLPFNQWPGGEQPAGLLAAFVMPNHPVVPPLLKRASEAMKQAGGDSALTGYQSRSLNQAKAQAAALYQAIQGLGLSYIGIPASFERTGQKIRLPDMILQEQMGNCLDLTLLIASCIEQMGMHPMVVLQKTHAFIGMWLIDERFPEGQVTDAARLRNQVALGQMIFWDAVVNIQDPPAPFDAAMAVAQRLLADDDAFGYALDIRVLRGERYLPLPIRNLVSAQPGAIAMSGGPEAGGPRHDLAALLREAAREVPAQETVAASSPRVLDRFQRWKDRLLDLSLRNKLLNFKPTGSSALGLEVPDLGVFEDMLAGDESLQLLPKPPQDSRDERDVKLLQIRGHEESWLLQRQQDLKSKIVHSSLLPGEFWDRARKLDLQAKADMEDGGVATLFAGIGILKWKESSDAQQHRQAPLLLYPIQLAFDRQLRRVRLKRLPEDPVPNYTLVEKMRRDYQVDLSFLTALETDDSGFDVPRMLQYARTAIQRMPGWEILEQGHLGHFTFAKFLLWKDLEDNAGILLKNPIIHHLALENEAFDTQRLLSDPGLLDDRAPSDLPMVLDGDGTQMAAIASALEGSSFVLQGPPGTGKSQTITNLIACALARGKRVLFVSEKMAALEVVYSRLKQVGLDDFCLELHSHKANRKGILESIQKVLNRVVHRDSESRDVQEKDLGDLKDRLNAYAIALHEVRPLGLSLHQAAARAQDLQLVPRVSLGDLVTLGLEASQFREWMKLTGEFAFRAKALESVSSNAWKGTDPGPWSQRGQEETQARVEKVQSSLKKFQSLVQPLADALPNVTLPDPPAGLEALLDLLMIFSQGPWPPVSLDATSWDTLLDRIAEHQTQLSELQDRRKRLAQRWTLALLDQPLDAIIQVYQQHAHTFPLFRWFSLWGARKQLAGFRVGSSADPLIVLQDLVEARSIQEAGRRLTQQGRNLELELKPIRWDEVESFSERAKVFHQVRMRLAGYQAPEAMARLVVALQALPLERWQGPTQDLLKILRIFQADEEAIHTSLGTGFRKAKSWDSASHLPNFARKLEGWSQAFPSFRAWSFYREEARKLEGMQLRPLVEAHGVGTIEADNLVESLEHSVLATWTALVQDGVPALRGFDGAQHHRRVDQFRQADRQWMGLCRTWIAKQLEARLPETGPGISENSEMGLLIRETKKKARHLAVRRLIHSIPNVLPRLKPCFLMSPLSVAQYLPADGPPFDLLIFDEASQICTHDAIGTLARAKQVVIVGDSRQLPPTSFFTRNFEEEETPNENDVEELESILDEAVAKQLPQQWLGWHYRSRHQALIEFSNQHYYENRLHIFPAAEYRADLGVRWNPVPEGVYYSSGCEVRKQERTNPKEAETLVAYLVERLLAGKHEDRSFGVVTFSMSQQQLIQDMLDEARGKYPDLEPHFQGAEPVFVKNLENVQGDERDEILFSIGYARDQKDRLRMHFGPLSIAGGERRLNVAITRARSQLRVFSTLTHDQIDLGRTSAKGAAHLRDFLRYAASFGSSHELQVPLVKFGSAFERELATAVESMGYAVHTQVGCGGYKLDLAVLDPRQPNRYLLGIEGDGEPYHAAHTARDRDRLRRQVLEGLGWRLHRVWSLDWILDQPREIQRLKATLEQAASAAPPTQETPIVPGPPTAVPATNSYEEPQMIQSKVMEAPSSLYPIQDTARQWAGDIFQEVALDPVLDDVPESFYLPQTRVRVVAQILLVVEGEGPLHLDDLAGKLVRTWGWQALTRRGRDHVEQILKSMARSTLLRVRGSFLWPTNLDPAVFKKVRRTPEGREPRDPDRIPPEELANAMIEVLRRNISMGEEDLLKEIAKFFGFKRVTSRMLDALRPGIQVLLSEGHIAKTNGMIQMT